MKIEFTCDQLPPSLNKLVGPKGYWHKHSATKKFEKIFQAMKLYEEIPDVQLKPPCMITVKRFSARTLDKDNFVGGLKPMIDALVHIGILKNDTKLMLQHGKHEQFIDRDNPRIEVEIEEIEKE